MAKVGRPLSERGVLRVGVSSDTIPLSYIDSDGKLTGFAVDILDAVAKAVDLKIERVPVAGARLHTRFKAGEFDLLQEWSYSPMREQHATFSIPMLVVQGVVYIRKSANPIRTMADFKGKKFAVVGVNGTGDQFLIDQKLDIEAIHAVSSNECLRLLEAGVCEGTYVSQLAALVLEQKNRYQHITRLDVPLINNDINHCMAVHVGDERLLARLNEGLAILTRNGERDRIYAKWYGRYDSPLIMRQTVVRDVAVALAIAFIAAVLALVRQHLLRRRITAQAAELAKQQALLRALFDNIPMAVSVLEAESDDYRVLAINRQVEKFLGLPAAQATGQLLSQLPIEDDWAALLERLLARCRRQSKLLREEHTLGPKHQKLIFTLVPMATSSAGHPLVCVLIEDVTERRNLDDEIAQSRRLRAVGELVGGIAHEFNNLLTPIIVQVGLIEEDWKHDKQLLGQLQIIGNAGRRSAELTRRLLTFGRKTETVIEPVNLHAAITSCLALLRMTVDRRINWEVAVPSDMPPLQFNATDLNQIVFNLIINARDALLEKLARHPDGWAPTICIEASLLPANALSRPSGEHAPAIILGWQKITVRDNGTGMPPEVRERVFEPFYTTKPAGKGSGLGLATVWQLVTEFGGRIDLESALDQGSAFHIHLPMLPPHEPILATPAHTTPQPPVRARIFFAEDEPLVTDAVTTALRRDGHTVTHLPDGVSAWQHLQTHARDYDILMFDGNMPGLSGIELAERIRSAGIFAGQIIICSGRLNSNDLARIAKAGIKHVLNKPFEIDELCHMVHACLPAGPK